MSAATVTDKITYRDLYERWEAGNWSATQLDFTQDKHDWHEVFTEHERNAAIWNYSLFFYGEDSVADNLSPYIDAAPHRGAEVLPRRRSRSTRRATRSSSRAS